MSRTKIITVAICSVLIAACNRSAEQPVPASTPTEVVADSTAAPEQAAASGIPENINPAVVLEAMPNPLELCDGNKLGTVEVKWDVTAAALSNFSIWVAAPGQERKLWMSSKDIVGSNKTGNWVRDQTKFSLVDDKGVVVATTMVTGGACAGTAETAAPGTKTPTE